MSWCLWLSYGAEVCELGECGCNTDSGWRSAVCKCSDSKRSTRTHEPCLFCFVVEAITRLQKFYWILIAYVGFRIQTHDHRLLPTFGTRRHGAVAASHGHHSRGKSSIFALSTPNSGIRLHNYFWVDRLIGCYHLLGPALAQLLRVALGYYCSTRVCMWRASPTTTHESEYRFHADGGDNAAVGTVVHSFAFTRTRLLMLASYRNTIRLVLLWRTFFYSFNERHGLMYELDQRPIFVFALKAPSMDSLLIT